MKIWILSDLHVDFRAWAPPAHAPDHDVLVIAGDVRDRLTTHVLPWIARNFEGLGRPIVYVPGNHDFWRANYDRERERAPDAARGLGITLLMDGSDPVVIAGVRFIGATLWSDFRLGGARHLAVEQARATMNDHRFIRWGAGYRKFTPESAERAHARALARIEAALAVPFDGPTVVTTHHAPSPLSLDGRRAREPLDGAYASDLTALIERHAPALWIHGHVHQQKDYRIGMTRVVCNPRGYTEERIMHGRRVAEEENPDFDPGLVVEVGHRGP